MNRPEIKTKPGAKRNLYLVLLILCLASLNMALGLLLIEKYVDANFRQKPVPCIFGNATRADSAEPKESPCEKMTKSNEATFTWRIWTWIPGGVPVALISSCFYLVLMMLSLVAAWRLISGSCEKNHLVTLKLATIPPALAAVWYGSLMYRAGTLCDWCVLVHVISLLVFLAGRMLRRSMDGGPPAAAKIYALARLGVLFALTLLAGATAYWVHVPTWREILTSNRCGVPVRLDAFFDDMIQVGESSTREMVEVFAPDCGECFLAYHLFKKVEEKIDVKFRVLLKPSVAHTCVQEPAPPSRGRIWKRRARGTQYRLAPHASCRASAYLLCLRKDRRRVSRLLEVILDREEWYAFFKRGGEGSGQAMEDALVNAGFDQAELHGCLDDPQVLRAMIRHERDAIADTLKIRGTPAFYSRGGVPFCWGSLAKRHLSHFLKKWYEMNPGAGEQKSGG